MTEQQPYRVVHAYDDFELRRYPAHLLAQVTTDGPFEDAGNRAFRYLFAYISGANQSRQKVAMTAPVVQTDAGEKIAMTAPVVQQQLEDPSGQAGAAGAGAVGNVGNEQFRVAFVLPENLTAETAPQPTDPNVQLQAVPESLTGAIRFSGRWSQARFDEHLVQLRQALAAAGLTVVGAPKFARFDPPFKPWFLRRNEVLLDVAPATNGA
ncbi:heme-binding protein [Cryobacterium sp. PH29-G1]|uniref:SOUL family heme-binding protein n=1 Tax=Cryobacterium sp. PH29-G1 TaxID=3046211 RepID=UPI0024B9F8B6|nr:heme-binding protein [Cryobacterium sp. PH29-G1]MDJ0350236.1 heme-binding protein [Cryobacterium sp. PH29-G1]